MTTFDDDLFEPDLDRTDCLQELSETYASYIKVDLSKEKKVFEETTEELLLKLEEFLSLVDLIRSDNTLCLMTTLPRIRERNADLSRIFERIDKLEAFVNIVSHNIEEVEARLTLAEKDLAPENSFSRLLKPLFSRKEALPRNTERQDTYNPPDIFKTSQYITPMLDSGSSAIESDSK